MDIFSRVIRSDRTTLITQLGMGTVTNLFTAAEREGLRISSVDLASSPVDSWTIPTFEGLSVRSDVWNAEVLVVCHDANEQDDVVNELYENFSFYGTTLPNLRTVVRVVHVR